MKKFISNFLLVVLFLFSAIYRYPGQHEGQREGAAGPGGFGGPWPNPRSARAPPTRSSHCGYKPGLGSGRGASRPPRPVPPSSVHSGVPRPVSNLNPFVPLSLPTLFPDSQLNLLDSKKQSRGVPTSLSILSLSLSTTH